MKFLIQVNQLEGKYSAVANVAKLLISEIRKRNEIVLLSYDSLVTNVSKKNVCKDFKGLKWYVYDTIPMRKLEAFYESTGWVTKKNIEKLMMCFKAPRRVLQSIDMNKFDFKGVVRKSVAILEEVVEQERPDAVITFTVPYVMAQILAEAGIEKSIQKIICQLDPFAENYMTPNYLYKKRLKLENWCNQTVDYVLVMRVLYILYKNTLYKDVIEKIIPLELPCVHEYLLKNSTDEHVFDNDKINCVFIGSLYKDIRNPEFLLDLFSQLENKKIVLHVFGSGCEEILEKYKKNARNNLQVHGIVSADFAFEIMDQADILVNVGNAIKNQTPSKLFDYISMGKPIVNIYKMKDDSTIEYLKRYPLALQIYDKLGDNMKKDIVLLEEFCMRNKGKRVPYQLIKSLYEECTIEYVVSKIEKLIMMKEFYDL